MEEGFIRVSPPQPENSLNTPSSASLGPYFEYFCLLFIKPFFLRLCNSLLTNIINIQNVKKYSKCYKKYSKLQGKKTLKNVKKCPEGSKKKKPADIRR